MPKQKISPFANAVYSATSMIPEGCISTYKLITEAINCPGSCRAVGRALARNPFAPEVPCHRVITSSYKIGGFYGDSNKDSVNVKKKLKMLKSEGIQFDKDDIHTIKKSSKYRNNILFTFN